MCQAMNLNNFFKERDFFSDYSDYSDYSENPETFKKAAPATRKEKQKPLTIVYTSDA